MTTRVEPSFRGASSDEEEDGFEPNYKGKVMEHEKQLVILEERSKNFATKEDLQKALNDFTWRVFGIASALVGVTYFIAENLH